MQRGLESRWEWLQTRALPMRRMMDGDGTSAMIKWHGTATGKMHEGRQLRAAAAFRVGHVAGGSGRRRAGRGAAAGGPGRDGRTAGVGTAAGVRDPCRRGRGTGR